MDIYIYNYIYIFKVPDILVPTTGLANVLPRKSDGDICLCRGLLRIFTKMGTVCTWNFHYFWTTPLVCWCCIDPRRILWVWVIHLCPNLGCNSSMSINTPPSCFVETMPPTCGELLYKYSIGSSSLTCAMVEYPHDMTHHTEAGRIGKSMEKWRS